MHDLDKDIKEFGGFITSPYWADISMSVTNDQLVLNIKHKFEHRTTRDEDRVAQQEILREDMSFDWKEYKIECNINDFNGHANT
jgi:hypothetical protein